MSIPHERKIKFLKKIGGESRIKNYAELMNYLDKIYQLDNWDNATINRINNIKKEEIGSALELLFYDHECWLNISTNLINTVAYN